MAAQIYRFGEFRFDPAIRELWCGDEEVSLPPKAFGCLTYLVEHRDRAVGRDELISEVWGKAELADSALGHAIMTVRRVLGDVGKEHLFIKTVPGFGYRWVAPVEAETHAEAVGQMTDRHRPYWIWWPAAAVLVIVGLIASAHYLWSDHDIVIDERAWSADGGDIALVLPVVVDAEADQGWLRFGAMELVADRLRAAGQPMVPGETVIALMRGLSEVPETDELEKLIRTTGARLIFGAEAQRENGRWRVSLRTLNPEVPSISTFAEADDVLEAARSAADRLALSLGLVPAPTPNAEPGLALLLQQVEAARLAQQMDLARELIESADPELRGVPEVRLQEGWVEYYSHHLDSAHAIFESLLKSPAAERDSVLRARVLHGLGGVYFQQGDHQATEMVLNEAMGLLDGQDALGIVGDIRRSMGVVALVQGKFDQARRHLAPARRELASIGDAQSLALLDNNRGVLEALNGNYPEALHYFEASADTLAALHDVGWELGVRANVVQTRLGLLDPGSALSYESRFRELIAQTSHPELVALGKLALASLLSANGRREEAETLLTEVLDTSASREDLHLLHISALSLPAEQLVQEGNYEEAAEVAAEVVERMPPGHSIMQDSGLGRAWLILIRSHIARGDLTTAADVGTRMSLWAQQSTTQAPRIYATLVEAELAAAEGRIEAAEAAFERALALAGSRQAPQRLLHVAESYVSWLLDMHTDSPSATDVEHALVVADRLTRYADQDYDAALLQLRIYHAVGPVSAWRAALVRARTLAGEREIPGEMLMAPETP